MSGEVKKEPARPLFLVKPNTIKARDIRRVEKACRIVIVECDDPDAVRLLEPPIDSEIDVQARAALKLMRRVIESNDSSFYKPQLQNWFLNALMYSPPPLPVKKVKR